MLTSYATALSLTVAAAVGWLAVQRAWRRTFVRDAPDEDALAARGGCQGCRCTEPCERRIASTLRSTEEGAR